MKYQRRVLITVPWWVHIGLWAMRCWYRVCGPTNWQALPWPRWASSRLYCVNGPITEVLDEQARLEAL